MWAKCRPIRRLRYFITKYELSNIYFYKIGRDIKKIYITVRHAIPIRWDAFAD